jgi:spermidine synthase
MRIGQPILWNLPLVHATPIHDQRQSPMANKPILPQVNVSEHGKVRYLHLGTEWVQGSMDTSKPYGLELEYVQRMQAWMLFVQTSEVAELHAMQLGLGAAALTKNCRKVLGMRTTAIELNPQVVAACRTWFKLPEDDELLSVVLGDAAEVAAHAHWRGQVDALHVDLYDHEAAAPVLDDADFYANCRQLLTANGCMVVNLFGRSSSFERSLGQIGQAFGEDAVWAFKPTKEGNTVVLAQRSPSRPERDVLQARAEEIETQWGLPATLWLKVLKPVAA